MQIIPVDADERRRQQMLVEFRALSTSRCRHVVDLYSAFFHEGRLHLALEYMDCGSLQDLLEKRRCVLVPCIQNSKTCLAKAPLSM
jgi:serine/threonine protein kinase